jgi:TolA-binding protein
MHELGCAQLGLKDARAAEQTLTQFLEKYPQHALAARARYARAMARQQLEKFSPAVEDLQAVLAATPAGRERSDARYLLGLCQVGLKQHAAAVATFRTLLEEDPKYPGADNARYQWAWALKLSGKEAEAAGAFAQLAADFPDSPWLAEAQHHVGEYAYQNQEYAKAAVAYHAATQKAAGTDLGEKAAHKLGWAFYHLGEFQRAEQTFRYQISVYPQGPLAQDAAFMVAESLFKQGKHAEALAAYQQVRNPSTKDFQVLALLHAAQAAGQLKQWQQSLEGLTRAAQQFPDSIYLPEILYEQGWAQQNLGRGDEALALYEQAIAKSGPGREAAARAQFMIGEIQFGRKQHDKAIESFIKVAYGYSYPKWQADAMFEAARCFEVLAMTAQAAKLYQDLIDKHPQSDKAAPAKQRLEALKKQ